MAVWWSDRHQSTEKWTITTLGNSSRPTIAPRMPRLAASPDSLSMRRSAWTPISMMSSSVVEVIRGSHCQ